MVDRILGQTKDVGFNIGVSRTLPYPIEVVWSFVTGPAGLALWLGELRGGLEPVRGRPVRDG